MYNREDIEVGSILPSRRYGDFEVITFDKKKMNTVRFVTTGKIYKKQTSAILSGEIADPYYPRVCGFGFLGIGKYKSKLNSKQTSSYKAWRALINRCYGKAYHARYRYDLTVGDVCEEWRNFQNFAEWFYSYKSALPEGVYEVDKDLLKGAVYSPQNCILLPHKLNTALITNNIRSGTQYPCGVCKGSDTGNYTAQISIRGLGTSAKKRTKSGFKTPEEAGRYYLKMKSEYLKELAEVCMKEGTVPQDVYKMLCDYAMELSQNEV